MAVKYDPVTNKYYDDAVNTGSTGNTAPTNTVAAGGSTPYGVDFLNASRAIGAKAPTDVDWNAYLNGNLDARTHWNNLSDPGVAAMHAAGWTPEEYAAYHYANDGSRRDLAPYNIYTIAQNKAAEEAAAKAESDRLAAEQQAREKQAYDTRVGSVNASRDASRQGATALLQSYGLDPAKYGAQLDSYYSGITNDLYGNTNDPYTSYDPSKIISGIVSQEQNKARAQYTNQANQQFGLNYGDTLISDSLLDNEINRILGEQKQSAADYVNRAKARGIYTDQGVDAANKAIGDDWSKGYSALTGLAGGILDKYQLQASDIGKQATDAASGYTLGSNFSFEPYLTKGQNLATSVGKNAPGELLNAMGGTNYFNLDDLNLTAGMGQGATGAKDIGIIQALADRQKQQSQSRGLGSQGAF